MKRTLLSLLALSFLSVFAVIGFLPASSGAEPLATVADGAPITRDFDVKEVLMLVKGINDPMGNKPATNEPNASRPATRPAGDQLVDQIRQNLSQETWRTVVATKVTTALLTVTAPPRVQDEIAAAINKITAELSQQVSIETRLFMLSTATVQGLSFVMPQFHDDGEPASPGQPLFITPDQLSSLIRAVQRSKKDGELTAPRLTLFNHQSSYITVASDQTYVAGFTQSNGKDGKAIYRPKSSTVPAMKLLLEMQPNVSSDRKNTSVKVHVYYSELLRLDKVPFEENKDLAYFVPHQTITDISATVDLPPERAAIFAGHLYANGGNASFVVVKATLLPAPHLEKTVPMVPGEIPGGL